jgi:hypothetical protein
MRVTASAPGAYFDQIFIPATPKIAENVPPSECQWRHQYLLANNHHDPRLIRDYPEAYQQQDFVAALAGSGVFYASGGGTPYLVDIDLWGLPAGGEITSVKALCRTPNNCGDFASEISRSGDRQVRVFAQSSKRDAVAQMEAVIQYRLRGTCPPVPAI